MPSFAFHRAAKTAAALCIVLLLAGAMLGAARAKPGLRQEAAKAQLLAAKETPLYLPSAKYVRLVTLGFDSFFTNVLWFVTLNYFGAHYETDKDYRWLGHMCDLVFSLDPKARYAADFCATLLAWVAREPQKSTELLSRAIAAEPQYWRYRYLRGFNYWYFLERTDLAEQDLREAARLPDAPPFVGSIASRLIAAKQDPQTAVDFLRELISRTNDPRAKRALGSRLKRARLTRDLTMLQRRAEQFEARQGRKPQDLHELVSAGLLRNVWLDPWGAEYYVDHNTGQVKTRSGKRGLDFTGKTAATGLAGKSSK